MDFSYETVEDSDDDSISDYELIDQVYIFDEEEED